MNCFIVFNELISLLGEMSCIPLSWLQEKMLSYMEMSHSKGFQHFKPIYFYIHY